MNKPYVYAVEENCGHLFIYTRMDGGQPTEKQGSVIKAGPNHYVAARHFGSRIVRAFQGPTDAMVVNESETFAKAARWCCGGFNGLSPRKPFESFHVDLWAARMLQTLMLVPNLYWRPLVYKSKGRTTLVPESVAAKAVTALGKVGYKTLVTDVGVNCLFSKSRGLSMLDEPNGQVEIKWFDAE